ncbi:hypothetical protein MKEN_00913600 [Mycena kentingensis (nom. inval.)]|nr:hypothetical protein MKEN_00913600 [Mycena kentingensis (nom. inval.)]
MRIDLSVLCHTRSSSSWSNTIHRRQEPSLSSSQASFSSSVSSASESSSSRSTSASSSSSVSRSASESISSSSASSIMSSASSSSSRPNSTSKPSSRPAPSSSQPPSTVSSVPLSSSITLAPSTSISGSISVSTVVQTSTAPDSTVFQTPVATGNTGGTPFARNVGGIVGVAIGALVAIVVGGTILFLLCRQFWPRKRRSNSPERVAEIELSAARAKGARSPHYSLRRGRPPMPPAPASSSSVAALLARFRRGSTTRTPQSEAGTFLDGAGAAAATPPLAMPPPAPIAIPAVQAQLLDSFSPTSPTTVPHQAPGSPRPSSLLNPRQYADSPVPEALNPPPLPPWLAHEEFTPPAEAADRAGTPQGLLRPSLATVQHSSFMDSIDYSRPIGGRIAVRSGSEQTVQTVPGAELGPLLGHVRDEVSTPHAL